MNATARRPEWVTLAMVIAAGLVNFLDRSSLSIALTSVRAEMHLSATEAGALLAAFSLAYGLGQLPVGPLLDRFGAWRVVGVGLAVWSGAQMLTGTVTSLQGFFPLRIVLGLGEAPFFPGAVKLIREWFPAERRGRALGAVNVSTAIGQGLAPPLLTGLMLWLGWRSMFVVIGGAGAVLAVLWFAVERGRPARSVDTAEVGVSISWQQWIALFRQPAMWGMMLGFGGINYTAWFYIAWLPTYLQQARGLSILRSGWLAAVPFFGASAGMYVSGVLSDARIRRGQSARAVHISQIVVGMVLSAAFTFSAARVLSVAAAVACMSSALFLIHFAGTSAWGYVHAVSRRNRVATVGSIQNFGSFVIASAGPFVTGWLLDRTRAFGSGFTLCGLMALVGAASYGFVVHRGDEKTAAL